MVYLKDVVTSSYKQEMCTVRDMSYRLSSQGASTLLTERLRQLSATPALSVVPVNATVLREQLLSAGVGCASALINQLLGRKKACCVVDNDEQKLSYKAHLTCLSERYTTINGRRMKLMLIFIIV